jgi:ribosomal protein L37AE/L43A
MKCTSCGHTEFENRVSEGIKICLGCAKVEQNNIVSDLEFANNAAHGYFLNKDRGQGALQCGSKY